MYGDKVRVECLNYSHILALPELELYIDEDDECHYISKKTFRGLSTGDDKKLHIYHNPERDTLSVWYKANCGHEVTLFDGIIKNRGALIELLYAIQIYKDE